MLFDLIDIHSKHLEDLNISESPEGAGAAPSQLFLPAVVGSYQAVFTLASFGIHFCEVRDSKNTFFAVKLLATSAGDCAQLWSNLPP